MAMFVAVVDCGSFAGAGQRLNLPGEAVAQGVALLEERIGARLVTRTGAGVHATAAGSRHAEHCRRILRGIDDAFAAAAGGRHGA